MRKKKHTWTDEQAITKLIYNMQVIIPPPPPPPPPRIVLSPKYLPGVGVRPLLRLACNKLKK
jgi:hypothetical protein